MSITWATFKKELWEVLRDKRTLVLTVLVPLVFYPALIALTGVLSVKQQQEVSERKLNVGIFSDDPRLVKQLESVDGGVQWFQQQDVSELEKLFLERKLDAYLVMEQQQNESPYEQRALKLHYLATADGDTYQQRIKRAFAMVSDRVVKERVKQADLPEEALTPYVVSLENRATARESSGSKFGGISAYFLVFLAFTGCMAVAVDVAAGEKERGTLEAILATPASFYQVAMGKLMFVVAMGLLSVVSTAGGIGLLMLIGLSAMGVGFGGVGFGTILAIILLLVLTVFFFAVVLFSLSMLAKSSKEAHLRSSLLMLVIAMILIYCTLPGVKVTNGILAIPVLNVAMALRALWEGTLSGVEYLIVSGTLLISALLVLRFVSQKVRHQPEKVLLK